VIDEKLQPKKYINPLPPEKCNSLYRNHPQNINKCYSINSIKHDVPSKRLYEVTHNVLMYIGKGLKSSKDIAYNIEN